MDAVLFVAERSNERFEIVAGRGEGYYVFRYVGEGRTHDYLQDSISMAMECAAEEFGLPKTAWRMVQGKAHD